MTGEVWHAPNIPKKKGKKKTQKLYSLSPTSSHPIPKRKKNGPLGCMLPHLIG